MALLRLLAGLFTMAGLVQGSTIASKLTRPVRLQILRVLRALEASTRRLIYLIALETIVLAVSRRKAAPVKASALRRAGQSSSAGFALCDRQWPTAPPAPARPNLRISIPGVFEPDFAPSAVPHDQGAALRERLQRVRRVLDDLSCPAKRMARWLAKPWPQRGRFSPLRPGRPPGLRKRSAHPVDAALRACHELAMEARLTV